jgi:hypothetical protein
LLVALGGLSLADVAKPDRLDRAGVDQGALFRLADRTGELTVEVGHPAEEPLREAAIELRAHRGVSVQLGVVLLPLAQALFERARGVGADLRPLLEVPARGRLVESIDGVLVEDEPAGRAQERHDLVQGTGKVGDVMQRQAGDDGVKRLGIREVLQRGGPEEVARGGVGVDRHDAVTRASERSREVTPATAHLEHASGHRRKMGMHERVELHPRLSAAGSPGSRNPWASTPDEGLGPTRGHDSAALASSYRRDKLGELHVAMR